MTRPEAIVEIAEEDARWQSVDLSMIATRAVTASLIELGLAPEGFEVSILACDDARIAELNAEFRDKPTATNVLSWPSEDRAPETHGEQPRLPDETDPTSAELGDLALAYETCLSEAQTSGISLDAHVTHLIVHGTLHLLGFDHIDDADADRMEILEVEILAKLGITDPYDLSVLD